MCYFGIVGFPFPPCTALKTAPVDVVRIAPGSAGFGLFLRVNESG